MVDRVDLWRSPEQRRVEADHLGFSLVLEEILSNVLIKVCDLFGDVEIEVRDKL